MRKFAARPFSLRAATAWFSATFLSFFILGTFLAALCIKGEFWQLILSISFITLIPSLLAGATGIGVYCATFWIPIGRAIWQSAAVCAIIFGFIYANIDFTDNFEGDRDRIGIPFTKQEQRERNDYWQDSYLVGALCGSLIGAAGAFVFAGIRLSISSVTGRSD